MRAALHGRLGALVEREYRLLFSATTITSLGDGVANIALAFAVLEIGSARSDRRTGRGPLGTEGALWLAVGAILLCNSIMLLIPAVWKIHRVEPVTTMA